MLSQCGLPRAFLPVVLGEKRQKDTSYSKLQKHDKVLVRARKAFRFMKESDGTTVSESEQTVIRLTNQHKGDLTAYLEYLETYSKFLHINDGKMGQELGIDLLIQKQTKVL